ncbi:histidine--tRNA ligase [Treponema phagedenis]|uniref:Histidine--tRNA ligase n=1 Tax=Treponema phagedenis TaxID=162 RepID=A0AAE6M688_TREPH|nr:histidine--tRNA ligase [Treponema phagedenis]EFW37782.1 histidine--tRNA ligase [Treponema phagedenis F0421]NVP25187.1 histidine--tRNA ligase [Treponema phagedenis]QEJ95953.1 histidine--tRNA ligase [Treponema phagedenis]QEJ97303.1 histidine--tRNA ligase [Treponema phagedenis]QEK00348.1 histidine--tRNA ligase [Treponema phagedenis]
MSDLISARILKGFRDFLPEAEIRRALLIEKLTEVFREAGFVPIDTPALEYSDVLLRKSGGETEKQVFRFTDNGGRDVALRFDLTVPFARFVAEHYSQLYFPFKRYHIAKVWRGEKPQAGRFREFVQCDFDIVGSDAACTDFEILKLMRQSLKAIGVDKILIHVSHRAIFNRFLTRLQLTEKSADVLRIVDKLAKVGEAQVLEELTALSDEASAQKILSYIKGGVPAVKPELFEQTLAYIEELAGGPAADTEHMREIYRLISALGINEFYVLDPSITRGLDYYTGVVFETFLTELPEIGSVCSGGRYDNLTGLYMKENISGTGASIGLDRLLAGLEQLGKINKDEGFISALVFCTGDADIARNQQIAAYLTEHGIPCEVFPDPKKMAQQYTYAEKKHIPWGIFPETSAGSIEDQQITLKHLPTRAEEKIPLRLAQEKIKTKAQ